MAAFNPVGCSSHSCTGEWATYLNELLREALTAERGRVFAHGAYGTLYALDSKAGKVLWTAKPGSLSGLSSANGVVYGATYNAGIVAYNEAGCGKATCSPLASIVRSASLGYSLPAPPVVIDGHVVISSEKGVLAMAVRWSSGQRRLPLDATNSRSCLSAFDA